MSCESPTPFERIDAAQEYLALLSQTVQENRQKMQREMMIVIHEPHKRYFEVLSVIAYNLDRLEQHLKASRQALSNLRKLRMLLISAELPKADDPDENRESLSEAS